MSQFLISVAAFIIAIGVLVAIHEYGHFWVARRMGVRVLRYSIGFGRKVWGFTSRKTGIEYWLAAIPLGGYVKMLDEREAPVAEADKPYAFNRVHPARRIAIVAAGPGVNFIFAILAYWLIFMIGVAGLKPIIGPVDADSLGARAGLRAHDQIVAVDGRTINDWQDLRLTLIERALDDKPVTLTVQNGDRPRHSSRLDLTGAPAIRKDSSRASVWPPTSRRPRRSSVPWSMIQPRPRRASAPAIASTRSLARKSPRRRRWSTRSRPVPARQVRLAVTRDGRQLTIPVALQQAEGADGQPIGRLGAQIGVDSSAWSGMRTTRQLGPIAAIPAAIGKTWELSALTVRLMGRMVTGDVSWKNVSGPIQIANYAGQTASIGFVAFVSFMALISVSLAVLNLLPIPDPGRRPSPVLLD